jgi:hypothetical protein
MRYASGAAFRQALETRLRRQSIETGMPLVRRRKLIAFDRLLARLVKAQPNAWVLKGGLALQVRFGQAARTTRDIDLLLVGVTENVYELLVQASRVDLADWFGFEIIRFRPIFPGQPGSSLRFQVRSLLDARLFEGFHIDVGMGDAMVEAPNAVVMPSLLDFAGIQATRIACFPITQHLAEKVHAYTLPRTTGESSRVKDLVDILLIAESESVGAETLRRALEATFAVRQTHGLPERLPPPPSNWGAPYQRLARESAIQFRSLEGGWKAAGNFLDPILTGAIEGTWDPSTWEWRG